MLLQQNVRRMISGYGTAAGDGVSPDEKHFKVAVEMFVSSHHRDDSFEQQKQRAIELVSGMTLRGGQDDHTLNTPLSMGGSLDFMGTDEDNAVIEMRALSGLSGCDSLGVDLQIKSIDESAMEKSTKL